MLKSNVYAILIYILIMYIADILNFMANLRVFLLQFQFRQAIYRIFFQLIYSTSVFFCMFQSAMP